MLFRSDVFDKLRKRGALSEADVDAALREVRVALLEADVALEVVKDLYESAWQDVQRKGAVIPQKEMDELLQRSSAKLSSTIAQCCAIKAEVVGKDEKEGGLRAILNYGHTLGHALEAISGYGHYLHGEAISIGMVAASHLSARLMEMPAKDVLRIRALLGRAGLPTSFKLAARQKDKLFEAMRLDKKVTGGEVQFVLAKRIGEVVWGQRVPLDAVQRALDQLRV